MQADLVGTQEADDAVKKAVARVPISLWHAVTPQLFTYLEHPKVCRTLCTSTLYCRCAPRKKKQMCILLMLEYSLGNDMQIYFC